MNKFLVSPAGSGVTNELVLVTTGCSGTINASSVVDTACSVATHHQNIVVYLVVYNLLLYSLQLRYSGVNNFLS